VVLHDRTLAAIAQTEPADLATLARIDGIGTVKLARYGETIVALVGGAEAPGSAR
jgi:superfamily II DNA helicase RecQ